EGADQRVALGDARALRREPKHGRRAAFSAQEKRRRHSSHRLQQLRQDDQARLAGADGGACRPQKRVQPTRAAGAGTTRGRRGWRGRRGARRRSRGRGGVRAALAKLSPGERRKYEKKLAEIDRKHPGDPPATVRDVVDHIDYALK